MVSEIANPVNTSDFLSRCREMALEYWRASFSVIPIRLDGTKRPKIKWQQFQNRRASESEVSAWFSEPVDAGIGIVCGRVSGNLEVLDFDKPSAFIAWSELLDDHTPGFFERLLVIETPSGGKHVLYRCAEIEGNRKLAMRGIDGARKVKTLIETRGGGGYFIAPGSPPAVHPSNKPYQVLDGDLFNPPLITPDERALLIGLACSLNEYFPPERVIGVLEQSAEKCDRLRPGDDFNAKASWAEVLEPHGWGCMKNRNGVGYWKRPGTSDKPYHATTNFGGRDMLHVFTTSTEFGAGMSHTKFGAHAVLNHAGDFRAAAKALAQEGYGGHKAECESQPDEDSDEDVDPPISCDERRERKLRAMARDAANVMDVIMQLFSALGVKGNHARIVNALLAVSGGRLTKFVTTHAILHERGYENLKPEWKDSAEKIKTGRVSRDISHLLDALFDAGLILRLPHSSEGLLDYRPGSRNLATGAGLGSKFRLNFLRYALMTLDYAMEKRQDFEFAWQARQAGVAQVAKSILKYNPPCRYEEGETENEKLLKASRRAKAALRRLSRVVAESGKDSGPIDQASEIVQKAALSWEGH
jgi:hypothetical protein